MKSHFKSTAGFTLAELLIVVAIVLVLASVAVPVFTGSLEKSREATDVANARSATSQVANAAMLRSEGNATVRVDGKGTYYMLVPLVQKQEGWQTESLANTGADESGTTHWVGQPKPDGTAKVTCSKDGKIVVYWNGNSLAVVADNAKSYEQALDAVLSSIYDGIVANRLSDNKNHIAYVQINKGVVSAVSCYKNESDKKGQGSSGLTQQDLDALNASIKQALSSTDYALANNTAMRVFFDWNGNIVSNDRSNGAPAIGGQGAYASLTFTPAKGGKGVTLTNSTGEWSL